MPLLALYCRTNVVGHICDGDRVRSQRGPEQVGGGRGGGPARLPDQVTIILSTSGADPDNLIWILNPDAGYKAKLFLDPDPDRSSIRIRIQAKRYGSGKKGSRTRKMLHILLKCLLPMLYDTQLFFFIFLLNSKTLFYRKRKKM